MFGVEIPRPSVELTAVRLMQLQSRVRRTILHRAGTALTKHTLNAVRGGRIPEVHGLLRRSLRRKIKVYTATATLFGIVGSDVRIKKQVDSYKDYRTGEMRRWRAGQPAKGPKYAAPAKYIHLAGPGRKSTVIQDALRQVRPQLNAIMLRILQDEIMRVS